MAERNVINPSFPEPPRNHPIVELPNCTVVSKGSSFMSFFCQLCKKDPEANAILALEEMPDGLSRPEDSVVPKRFNSVKDFCCYISCNNICNPGKNVIQILNFDLHSFQIIIRYLFQF